MASCVSGTGGWFLTAGAAWEARYPLLAGNTDPAEEGPDRHCAQRYKRSTLFTPRLSRPQPPGRGRLLGS